LCKNVDKNGENFLQMQTLIFSLYLLHSQILVSIEFLDNNIAIIYHCETSHN